MHPPSLFATHRCSKWGDVGHPSLLQEGGSDSRQESRFGSSASHTRAVLHALQCSALTVGAMYSLSCNNRSGHRLNHGIACATMWECLSVSTQIALDVSYEVVAWRTWRRCLSTYAKRSNVAMFLQQSVIRHCLRARAWALVRHDQHKRVERSGDASNTAAHESLENVL